MLRNFMMRIIHHLIYSVSSVFAQKVVVERCLDLHLTLRKHDESHEAIWLMLDTVAAVPGIVGGVLLHLRSLCKFQQSGGWIKALLKEAENERMHLMTMVELVQPKWYERLLVLPVQEVFFNAYFVLYVLSPKLAHRVVGYLEEEATHSHTEYLKHLSDGKIENVPAPAFAIDYWKLPKDATLKDVITVIHPDEAQHRDVNHFASDIHYQGKELREAPALLGYHLYFLHTYLLLFYFFTLDEKNVVK